MKPRTAWDFIHCAELTLALQAHPSFCVLAYHSIGPKPLISKISASSLRRSLAFLKRRYRLIATSELIERLVRGDNFKTRPRLASVTFDDGYANMYCHVLPILEELAIPATFFISTYHCMPGRYLWCSMLQAFRKCYNVEEVEILDKAWPTRTESERTKVSQAILERFTGTNCMGLTEFLEQFMPSVGSFVPADIVQDYFAGLSPEQVVRLARSEYADIGAHSVTHPFLAGCPRGVKEVECRESIEFLQTMTGREVRWFAYPSGSYDGETMEVLRGLNVQGAFTMRSGFGRERLYEIPRVNVASPSLVSMDIKYRRMPAVIRLAKGVRLWLGSFRGG